MLIAPKEPAVTLARDPWSIPMPSTVGASFSIMPIFTIPARPLTSMAGGMVSPQNGVVPYAGPNIDAMNCAKCEALQQFGGVLNDIRASTALHVANVPEMNYDSDETGRSTRRTCSAWFLALLGKGGYSRESGNQLRKCEHLGAGRHEGRAAKPQNLLLKSLSPNAIIAANTKQLKKIG